MKLYLSSFKFGNEPEKLVALASSNKKIAVIPNALDFSTDIVRRQESMQKEIDGLKSLGFEPEILDLRDYFGKKDLLKEKMGEFGGVWVRGGNVFVLRKAYKESGFDEWLISQKDNKELLYAGYSAGVCVLTPSLKGLELVDDINISPDGYKPDIVWEGLGLINYAFAPHYHSNHPESESINTVVDYYIKNGIEYKALHDGEVTIQEI